MSTDMVGSRKEGILIVSAGIMQIPAIKAAKELGLFVIATDRNPDAPGFALCDMGVALDSKDVEGHVRFASENAEKFNIKGAFAGSDVAITVAGITNALGLPGIPVSVAERSNNKAKMKERWVRDGIPTPFGQEASTLDEAKAILRRVGLPAIVKAVDNAASRGSKKITEESQLPEAFEKAKAASRSNTAIIEEYVIGNEQSVESIVWNGRTYHVGMADREFGYHPFHIETAHCDPSVLPLDAQKRIYDVVDAAAESLGIDFGPAKADMIWTAKGPMILEMPARLSGGFHSQYTTPLSSGRNPIKAVMEISLGKDLDETWLKATRNLTAICSGIFPGPGQIKSIHGVDEARAIDGVEQVIITKGPGDRVDEYVDNGQRFCWVITIGESMAEARSRFEQAARAIRFEIV
jgi:biotin carboxylase